MKLILATINLILVTSVSAFAPSMVARSVSTSLDGSVVYYSSSTGNTETVGQYIADAAGVSLEEIGDASDDEIKGFESIIVGAPTWHTGADEQRSGTSWDEFLYENLPNIDLANTKVAVFGVGDQQSYNDNFCDAAGELYDLFEAKGCKMFGLTSPEGYVHSESKAERDGKFCGLMCDEDNQYDLSDDRAKAWVGQLKEEGFFA